MAGLFGKAMKDAAFSVTMSKDGSRSFDKGKKRWPTLRSLYHGVNSNKTNKKTAVLLNITLTLF